MKSLKKFLLIVAMATIFGVSAFAESGFELIINAPLQMSLGIPPKILKDSAEAKGEKGIDYGVSAQFGYMAQILNGFGISLLAEIGYSHDNFNISVNARDIGIATNERVGFYYGFENLQIGLLPKLNIGAFSIGIGGGVKIPLSGTLFAGYSGIDAVKIFNDEKVNRTDISDLFSPSVIGYIKATFDYSFFFTDKIAMNFGLYLGYDFGMKIKNLTLGGNGIGGGAFNLGLQLGFRFGPKA